MARTRALHCRASGAPDAPPIVLLHGVGNTGGMWLPVARQGWIGKFPDAQVAMVRACVEDRPLPDVLEPVPAGR